MLFDQMNVVDELVAQEIMQQIIYTSLLNEVREVTEEQGLNVPEKFNKLLIEQFDMIPYELQKKLYFRVFQDKPVRPIVRKVNIRDFIMENMIHS